MSHILVAAGIYAGLGVVGGTAAKLDEGNWGSCTQCGCGACRWDIGSFGGKMVSLGINNSCAFKRCVCGHHFTAHRRNS